MQQNGHDKYVFRLDTRVNRSDASRQFDYCPEEIGFDDWIRVDVPGDYHVVAYSINVHGSEGKRNIGEKDITVGSGYTVNYNANGGSGSVPAAQMRDRFSSFTIGEPNLTREGYTFVGWNTEAGSDGKHFNPGATYSDFASVTLYAQWVRTSFFHSHNFIRSVDDWNDLATMINNGCGISKVNNIIVPSILLMILAMTHPSRAA